jgi:hypothetical protein
MADYIPQNDLEFTAWQASLIEIIDSNAADWGIPTDDFSALIAKQTIWNTAFAKASNKQNRTSADVQAKEDARVSYVKDLRGFVAQWLASNSKVSNSDRERMGLTVKSGTRTPVPVPVTLPVGTIDFSIRLQHTIQYADEATPRSKAKPTGVHGCEIWMKIDGIAPVDASELSYVATDTSSPYIVNFEGKYAGKIVYYWLRWVNTRGEHGPWGSTISAMVVG